MMRVLVSGSFDDLRSRKMRFLQEAARLGELHVRMWSDDVTLALTGSSPVFPQAERWYFLQAVRYLSHLALVNRPEDAVTWTLPGGEPPDIWAILNSVDEPAPEARRAAEAAGVEIRVLSDADLQGFPVPEENAWEAPTGAKKVIVTGCYDWLHTGHIRFFEEVAELGDLYVAVGNDVNVRHLKGEGHPMFSEDLRRYMVQSIRYVKQAVLTKGMGWMDAAPNIAEIHSDIYAVNEDGDKPEKRAFCAEHGLEYVVLQRRPKEGLTRRSSTELRGF
jgi:cytidyltransferase-like protein